MTSTETGPTWSERLNPRNWTLAWKLVVVGLVPALLALVLGVLRVSDQAGQASDLGQSSRLLVVQEQVAEAADALRQERDEAVVFVAGSRAGDRGVLDIGFAETDTQVDEMLAAVRGADELDPTTRTAVAQAETNLTGLAVLRSDALGAALPDQLRTRYTDLVGSVDVLDRALLRQLRTPDIAGIADASTAATSASEQLALQHTVLGAAIRASTLAPEQAAVAAGTAIQLASDVRRYNTALTPEQLARFGGLIDDAADADRVRLAAAISDTPENRPITLAPAEWDAAYNSSRAATDRATDLLRNELVATSAAAEEKASNLAGINSVILMIGLLIGIAIAVLVARALIRSLRVLRTAALDVAERRLPDAVESMRAGEAMDVTVDPVPLTGRDEVAQVARAFDAVHGQAIRLASDQAALQANVSAMFVNLSRRSQALVERQLQLIEQLESNEQDADQLSNLFQLDHLATRMRRNSENLLVLAGTDLAKRNIAPVPMVDVLRAAVSEVEQYQRVVVQAPPTVTIVGRAASDLVHLLAELLDNATNFSPPDSQVVMSTARTGDGSLVVEIADRGVGMIDHELDDANQRLGGPSSVDVSASRRMGLFVVGRLGARHGIGVRLSTSSGGGPGAGLTASVSVPVYLVPAIETPGSGRPAGVGQATGANGVPRQSRSFGVPPQRAGANGSGPGSLSSLVAGTDGPPNPTGVFDVPAGQDNALFGVTPQVNGGTPGLPTRRPGSSLRPGEPGPTGPDSPGFDSTGSGPAAPIPGDRAAADRAAAEKAREVAARARRDQQEAAERTAAERAAVESGAHEPGETAAPDEGARNGLFSNGSHPNGTSPNSSSSDAGEAAAVDAESAAAAASALEADSAVEADSDAPAVEPTAAGSAAADATANGDDVVATEKAAAPPAEPAKAAPTPTAAGPGETAQPQRPVPPSAPTTPMPLVFRAGGAVPPAGAPDQRPPQQGRQRPSQQPAQQQGHGQQAQRPLPQPGQGQQPSQGQRPAQAPRQPDGLFAPSVPVIAEPDSSPIGHRPEAQASGFEMGETTPIFAEIASAWFRSNRPVPVDYETEKAAPPPQQAPPAARPAAPAPAPVAPPAPVRPAEPVAEEVPQPDRVSALAGSGLAGSGLAGSGLAGSGLAGSGSDQGFANQSDEGWRAASGTVVADRSDELTSAGLPKRRPRARLVPGSAGSAVLAPPVTAARSAENVRGRLASYQQGVRQGRESRARGAAGSVTNGGTEPANAGGNHDEESS